MKEEENDRKHLIHELAAHREQVTFLENAATDYNAEVETLLDSLQDYVSIIDPDGKVVRINQGLLNCLGYKRNEITDTHFLDLYPLHARSELKGIVASLEVDKKHTFTLPVLSKAGKEIPLETTITRRYAGSKDLIFCISRDLTERKSTEGLLQEQVHFLQTLIDAVPTPIFYKSVDLKYLGCNKALEIWDGIARDDMINKTVYDLRPKDEADRHHKTDTDLLEKGGNVVYETLSCQADGNIHNSIISKGVFKRPDGTVGGIAGVILDITERKRAQEELEQQSRILDIMTSQMADMVYYKDRGFRYVFSSKPHCERILGCTQAECIGHTDKEIVRLYGRERIKGPGPEEVFGKSDREAKNAGKASKFEEMTTVNGESIWLEIYNTPLYDDNGDFAGIVGCSRDITDRKFSEQRLEESEERLRLLIEGSDDVITLQDREGRFLYYNGTRRYGFKGDTILGKTPYDVFLPEEASRMMEHLSYVFQSGQRMTTEEDIIRDEGRLWFNVKRYPIKDDISNIISVATISRNITDRKRMEEDLIKAQKLESIGTLAGGIAHDFNNILTVILGNITLAKMSIAEDNKAFKRLKDSEKATMRAKDLTQQLLTFAKGGEPFKRVIFINRLIEDTASLSLSGSNTRYEYKMADNLFPVEIDEGQIRQVIHNIAINAKESMPSGGVATIRTENVTLGSENNLSLKKGRYIKISIEDKGSGIPESYLSKIFDPYFTTKEMGSQKGTGLGLAICYSIVRKHNGHIGVESTVGVGSTFHIYLPAYQKELAMDTQIDKTFIGSKGRVLLMDDEEMIREITDEILSTLGYEVKFAKDGDEAIELFKKAKESDRPFHAVILDLTIPGGMGGKEAMQKILKIDRQVKGIVSSGYSNDPVMANYRKYGFSGIISKPFMIEELNEVLRHVIMDSNERTE
ncbi:MAG: hypothetical protein C0392_00740 [Syntrophus sp. (in: bacteria)]|nr:hypothetical protein [Syntrophus sp. (in: bacteria)]